MKELMGVGSVIEAYNECYEKQYIELERNVQMERTMDLEVLITKCKRLLSFIEMREEVTTFDRMNYFIAKVRQAKYQGGDVKYLFREFEDIETAIKKSSKSFDNLSGAE
tara:strand:+ start:4031 stop:4357 length:327 start_codon:yes stop_codon:yes gene_type:complete